MVKISSPLFFDRLGMQRPQKAGCTAPPSAPVWRWAGDLLVFKGPRSRSRVTTPHLQSSLCWDHSGLSDPWPWFLTRVGRGAIFLVRVPYAFLRCNPIRPRRAQFCARAALTDLNESPLNMLSQGRVRASRTATIQRPGLCLLCKFYRREWGNLLAYLAWEQYHTFVNIFLPKGKRDS